MAAELKTQKSSPRSRLVFGNARGYLDKRYIEDVSMSGPKAKTQVTWKLKGAWSKDPDATVSVFLSQSDPHRDVATLAKAVRHDLCEATVDLSG